MAGYSNFPHGLSSRSDWEVAVLRREDAISHAPQSSRRFMMAPEPVSMLDVSIRAELLHLLLKLKDEKGLAILYTTHDLATAGFFTDRMAVMYLGRIVEIGKTRDILSNPQHPYTKSLISVLT